MNERIVILDFLRSLAMVFVITEHVAMVYKSPLAGFYGIKGFYFYGLGGFGVSIFLVVSGAAIELKLSSSDHCGFPKTRARCRN